MKILNGKQAVLSFEVDDVYYPALCAIDVAFQFDHEEILKTTVGSGKFRERDARLCDWGITLTGLTKVNNADGQLSFFYLTQQGVRGTTKKFRLRYTDDDSNVVNVYGSVLIKQGSLTSAVDGFSTATHFFPGSGPFTTDVIANPTPRELFKLYMATTPGAFEVSHADLDGAAEIMFVTREGRGYTEVTGTPSGRQFKYTDGTGSGKITFDSSLVFGAGEIVYVQYKK